MKREQPSVISLWLPVFGYMAVIFGMSSLAAPPSVGSDVSAHFVEYAVLGALAARACSGGLSRARFGACVTGWLLATAYGATDEIHQRFVPGRHAEWKDWMMDGVGASAGAFLVWVAALRRRELSRGASR